jgi:branched-chain amino acid transport system permease protein
VLIVLILGGFGRMYGAFVGAIAYLVLEHTLAKAYPTSWQLAIGVTLIVVALYARNGILGLVETLRRRARRQGAR